MKRIYTDKNLKDRLKKIQKKVGHTPSRLEVDASDPKLRSLMEFRFGTWNEAKKKLGAKATPQGDPLGKHEMILVLRRWFKKNDVSPWGRHEWKGLGYSYRSYVRHFGSIKNAYEFAGVERVGNKYKVV